MKEWTSEINYMTTMTIVKNLLKQGVFTEDDYKEIDTIMHEKYHASLGGLLFDITLNTV